MTNKDALEYKASLFVMKFEKRSIIRHKIYFSEFVEITHLCAGTE